jgi:aspartate beta-hydroxylase
VNAAAEGIRPIAHDERDEYELGNIRAAGMERLFTEVPELVQSLTAQYGDPHGLDRVGEWLSIFARRLQGDPTAPEPKPGHWCRILWVDAFPEARYLDPAQLEACRELEAAYPMIREEFERDFANTQSYRLYGGPGGWDCLMFYQAGGRIESTAARYPRTSALLDRLGGLGPIATQVSDVFISRLNAGAVIEPHHGTFNLHLVCHLGLKCPPEAWLKVGGEQRHWQEGKCLVFDDSFEHEAANPSAVDRYVLLVQLWRPELSPIERAFFLKVAPLAYEMMGWWRNGAPRTRENG